MKNSYLLHLATSIVVALSALVVIQGKPRCIQDPTYPVIIIQHPSTSGNPRGDNHLEITAYYDAGLLSVFANIECEGNNVSVDIQNTSSNESFCYVIPGSGSSVLPISGTSGYWTITFTLENGSVYYGYFVL